MLRMSLWVSGSASYKLLLFAMPATAWRLTPFMGRCLAQLALLGLALALVLRAHLWWLAMLFGAGMTAVAAGEAVSQPSASYEARPQHCVGVTSAVAASCAAQSYQILCCCDEEEGGHWHECVLGHAELTAVLCAT